jgi:hypothetical protein
MVRRTKQVARKQQRQARRHIEQQNPGAREGLDLLGQEGEAKQADECDVPKLEAMPQVMPKAHDVRQAVFTAEQISEDEDARACQADGGKRQRVAELAIGGEVVTDAGEQRNHHDHADVSEQEPR